MGHHSDGGVGDHRGRGGVWPVGRFASRVHDRDVIVRSYEPYERTRETPSTDRSRWPVAGRCRRATGRSRAVAFAGVWAFVWTGRQGARGDARCNVRTGSTPRSGGSARHGVEGVRVEPLAEDLGVTKGSFYWHFKDRPDLLDAVLEEWEATDTRLIDAAVEPGTPAERMSRFVELITASARNPDQAAVESAVLAWAQVDPVVAERVARVEATRVRNTERLLLDLGFPPDGAGEVGRSGLHDLRGDDEPRETRCEVSAAAELGVSRSAARSGSASGGCSTQAAGGSLTVVVSSPVVWPPPTSIGTSVSSARRAGPARRRWGRNGGRARSRRRLRRPSRWRRRASWC